SSLTVPAGGSATVNVTLNVPAATVGSSAASREVAGLITLTPATAADNGSVALRVPYYYVPRALSKVNPALNGPLTPGQPTQTATLTNAGGARAGNGDFYAWGLAAPNARQTATHNVRAVGVQSFPFTGGDQLVVFAVNTFARWSSASTHEFDIY